MKNKKEIPYNFLESNTTLHKYMIVAMRICKKKRINASY